MRITTLLLSTSLMLTAGLAEAQEGGPPAQLQEAMKFLNGNWKCTGKQHASEAMGPEQKLNSKISVKPDLNKHWYMMRLDEKTTKYAMMVAIGWDGTKLQRADFDNQGGITHASSTGWKDGSLVWEGTSQTGPNKMGFRETLTQDKKNLNSKIEFQINGKWTPMFEYSCKK
jgi:hypothetical protein